MPDCISLGVGEPDFQDPLGRAGKPASKAWSWATRYTSMRAWKELRIEISRYLGGAAVRPP